MTSLFSESSRSAIGENALSVIGTQLGATVVLLTIGLLTGRELLRAGNRRLDRSARAIDVALVPLLLASGYVIVVRMIDILGIV